jgi:hypothetical protein
MTPTLKKAVQAALAAQGNVIYDGQSLNLSEFIPKPSSCIPAQRNSYQAIYKEKKRAGFPHLSVKDYCKMMTQ